MQLPHVLCLGVQCHCRKALAHHTLNRYPSLCSSVTCHCQSSYRGCLINSELKLHLIYNFYAINEGNENVCLYSSFLCICFKTAVLNHECVITSDIAKNDQNLNPKFLPSSWWTKFLSTSIYYKQRKWNWGVGAIFMLFLNRLIRKVFDRAASLLPCHTLS